MHAGDQDPLAVLTGRLPRSERRAAGREARSRVPRRTLARWEPQPNRDPLATVRAANEGRNPDLIPLRIGRMVASPFRFYRGTADLMAEDLAGVPTSGLRVQACGDAHLANFGAYATAERRQLFGLNDFDETLPGPWEWDLKRLAASVALAARDRAFGAGVAEEAVRSAAAAYQRWLALFAEMPELELWYLSVEASTLVDVLGADPVLIGRVFDKARRRTSAAVLPKLTGMVDGERQILENPPIVTAVDLPDLNQRIHTAYHGYMESVRPDMRHLLRRFRLVDVAHKVVGVGSVGVACYIMLLLDADGTEPLFLQLKEARPSVLERWISPSEYANAGERVVAGQRLIQPASDPFLGWYRSIDGRQFYVRQLRDMKGGFDIDRLTAEELVVYGAICGFVLARSHSRTGDPAALHGYVGVSDKVQDTIWSFSNAYADQAERDHAALLTEVRAGRFPVIEGV